MVTSDERPGEGAFGKSGTAEAAEQPGRRIGAIYRRMSTWYILFSILLFVVILFVGYRLTRPLLEGPLSPSGG